MLADLTVLRPSRPQANMAESDFALREKHKTAGPSGEDRCEGTAVCRVLRPHLACVVVTCVCSTAFAAKAPPFMANSLRFTGMRRKR